MHAVVVVIALSLSAQTENETLLVLDLDHSADVGDDVARTMTDLVVSEVSARVKNRVVSGTDIRNLTALEGEKQAFGCDTDSSCLAEIASAMGARYLVSGRVSSLGPELVLQLSLFDATKAEPIGRQNVRAASLPALADRVPDVVAALLQPLGATAPSASVGKSVSAEHAIEDDASFSLLSWGLIGGGAALAALGLLGLAPMTGFVALALSDMIDPGKGAAVREDARVLFYLAGAAALVALVVAGAGASVATAGLFVE